MLCTVDWNFLLGQGALIQIVAEYLAAYPLVAILDVLGCNLPCHLDEEQDFVVAVVVVVALELKNVVLDEIAPCALSQLQSGYRDEELADYDPFDYIVGFANLVGDETEGIDDDAAFFGEHIRRNLGWALHSDTPELEDIHEEHVVVEFGMALDEFVASLDVVCLGTVVFVPVGGDNQR